MLAELGGDEGGWGDGGGRRGYTYQKEDEGWTE